MNNALSIRSAARTDVGLRRSVNEDAVLASHSVYIVADGMGGHSAGDAASAAAIEAFAELATQNRSLGLDEVDAAIAAARAAVDEISVTAENGAGCTLSGAFMVEHGGEPSWYIINIGDSRVYQHSAAAFTQLTIDHSLYAELAAAGHEDAERTPRNVITRALGSDDARHDGWLLPIRTGVRLLVCSDGLTGEVDDAELNEVLSSGAPIESIADELIERARDSGGRDNVTVIVVEAVGTGAHGDPDEIDDFDEDTLEVTRPAW